MISMRQAKESARLTAQTRGPSKITPNLVHNYLKGNPANMIQETRVVTRWNPEASQYSQIFERTPVEERGKYPNKNN